MTAEERARQAYRAWQGAPVTELFDLIAAQIREAEEAMRTKCIHAADSIFRKHIGMGRDGELKQEAVVEVMRAIHTL